MSKSVYLREKIAEYRHNEIIATLFFLAGVVLLILGLGLAGITAIKIEWFLI